MRTTLALTLMIVVIPAHAVGSFSAGYGYTDYSRGYGNKKISYAEMNQKLDKGALVLNAASGKRVYSNESYSGTRARGTLYYNWHPTLSTRSGLSWSTHSPVFVRREVFNDFNFKLIKRTVFTVGGRHASYYGDNRVNSWSAGGALYLGAAIATYRYTHYASSDSGNSYSHLLSLRVKDSAGQGYTQLWLGSGTARYAYDWRPDSQSGRMHSVSLKRFQPLTKDIALTLVAGRQWYNTPLRDYQGTFVEGGIVFQW
jgi:YaiO family outer membrane protein